MMTQPYEYQVRCYEGSVVLKINGEAKEVLDEDEAILCAKMIKDLEPDRDFWLVKRRVVPGSGLEFKWETYA